MNTEEPMAYFLTWVTYGSWLPGDQRGWVDYQDGPRNPEPRLERNCRMRMIEGTVRLNRVHRTAVEHQIAETCLLRNWHLHAVNCRSNHVHTVITAIDVSPAKIRKDLKAYTSRCLREICSNQKNWWAERGSVRFIYKDDDLETVIDYVLNCQDK